MIWILSPRPPLPDAPYWPGRRLLAVVDAIAWPLAAAMLLTHAHGPHGIFVPTVNVVLVSVAVGSALKATLLNHRYRFTTWRLVRYVLLLSAIGLVLKLALLLG